MVKRKRAAGSGKAKAKAKVSALDGSLEGAVSSGDEGSDADADGGADRENEEDAFFETPDEKRVRLAKAYLNKLEESRPREEVQAQLSHDVEEQARRTRVQIDGLSLGEFRYFKGHRDCATCVCMSSDDRTLYSGSKDCTLVKWDVETGQRAEVFVGGKNKFECGGHFAVVLGVCLMEEKGLLASVGVDRLVRLWDLKAPPRSSCIKQLFGHTGTITGVCADPDGAQFYTSSVDKSLKIWDTGSGRNSETLLGHVAAVNAMDIYHKGRPLTGGFDKTVRLWKVDRETHLLFNKHTYPVSAVSVVDADRFVSGSEDGSMHLWSGASKKPLVSAAIGRNMWITALAAIRGGNVFFSGSTDGKLRCWRFARLAAAKEERNGKADSKAGALQLMEATGVTELPGVINGIAVGRRLVACALGREHKYGRWFHDKSYKRGLAVVPLSYEQHE